LATFIYELKVKYQFEVSENKVVNFFLPIGVHEPLRGPRTPRCERLFLGILERTDTSGCDPELSQDLGSFQLDTSSTYGSQQTKMQNNRVICSDQEQ